MIRLSLAHSLVPFLPLSLLVACGPSTEFEGYAFASRADGTDSVSYGGQVFRNLLVTDLKSHLDGITERLNTDFVPAAGDVEAELDFYFLFDSATSGPLPLGLTTTPQTFQEAYDDVSTDKDLQGKIAGNDAVGQHVDWATAFVGWDDPSVTTPESLVRRWFRDIDAAAVAWVGGAPLDPDGNPVPAVYVSPEGLDYQQLLEKFLRGAVAFSQGADDYLDDDTEDKGLLADHTAVEDGSPYTALEHAWDEGFGYFGAARTYDTWTDEEIADAYKDVNGDGVIDLATEYSWGHSSNAAKRDLGAVAATDFTADAWEGFYEGRALIASLTTTPTDGELDSIRGYRDQALEAWEAAIASTVVHYINDVIQDMSAFGTEDYSFGDHAKHWAEMKGFALSFQFNRLSPMSDADFAQMHALMGDAPVLGSAEADDQAAYVADLIEARSLIGAAYGFDTANLGDANGLGGW